MQNLFQLLQSFNNFRLCSDARCGLATVLSEYSKLQTLLNQALLSPTINTSCFETITPPNASAARTAAWIGTIAHTVTLSWADAGSVGRFFNTGGKIVWTGAVTNTSSAVDVAWQTALASIPNVTVTKSNTTQGAQTSTIGFEDLTTANQTMFSHVLATRSVLIQGKVNTTGNVLTLTISFNDSATVTGSFTSGISLTRVGALCYNNPPVAYPASSSVGIA
jgi:hypothetical protein